jgi:hypothetical protein
MPKVEEECYHLVLLSSGKGSQLVFNLPNAHDQKLRDAEPHCKHSIADRKRSGTARPRRSACNENGRARLPAAALFGELIDLLNHSAYARGYPALQW